MRKSLTCNALSRIVTRRFWVVFTCVFLLMNIVAWSRHTMKEGELVFLSADFLYFSIAAFTTGFPFALVVSALVVLLRMRTSGEVDMLRTFGIPPGEVVRLLSHSLKVVFLLLVVAREIIVPQVRWDIVRVVHPGRPERFGPVVMKTKNADVFMKVSGDYTGISELYRCKNERWTKSVNLHFDGKRWRNRNGASVQAPPPSEMILSDPRSLEFLGARELLGLSKQSELRGPYFFVLFLEHLSSIVLFYLLLVILCRVFVGTGSNVFHILLAATAFLITAYLTLFAVRHVAGSFQGGWSQAVASFTPVVLLLIAASATRSRRPVPVAGKGPAPV